LRLAVAIAVGILLIGTAVWFSFSKELRSLEQRSAITDLAISLFAVLSGFVWLRRITKTSAKTDTVSYFYRLCMALALAILAGLLASWGFGGLLSPTLEWVAILSTAALLIVAYVLMLFGMLRHNA
jgi:drug/metabolite transporter (DMT)-like permease